MSDALLFEGTIIHCLDSSNLEIIENGYLYVRDNEIVYLGKNEPEILTDTFRIQLTKTQFLIPGFVDTHIHASQYANVGLGYDEELYEWLLKYTLPEEQKFQNINYAAKIYNQVVRRTLLNGTTTACYYGTTHMESNLKLVDAALEFQQRCFVGHVNVTKVAPFFPESQYQSVEEAIKETESFINATFAKQSKLVRPIITPSSTLSSDMGLMQELSKLASKCSLLIQTHLSENQKFDSKTLDKYPDASSCTQVLEQANLLTTGTILAHCVHLDDEEKKLIVKYGSAVSHCPQSNTYLHSGFCDIRDLSKYGIKCSLGTDISAGASSSILEVMRSGLQTAHHLDYGRKKDPKWLTYKDVFYLATLGGAKALNLDEKIGNFQIGNELDALLIEVNTGCIDLLENLSADELLQKFIYLGDDRNIQKVYVDSKCVVDNSRGA